MVPFPFLAARIAWFFIATAIIGSAYQIFATYAVRRSSAFRTLKPRQRSPVTLLKPLCGEEPELYDNLRSFCELDYPKLQVICGVRDPNDPAIAIVKKLQSDLPQIDISLVQNATIYGTNYKISNLINMMSAVKYDILVLSDSDMHVDQGYLDAVVGSLERPGTGLATCLYIGRPTPGPWSAIGAAGINFWFLPSAMVSKLLGGETGCYGATIALRRDTLDSVGGFAALKDQLADDYALGELVRDSGKKITVVPYILETTVDETSFMALFRHELRWARTIRNTAPIGFAASAITHPTALALIALAFGLVAGLPLQMLILILASAILCRFVLVNRVLRSLGAPKLRWWLLLPRDILSLVILILAFCGRSVSWRNSAFRVDSAGALSAEKDGI